MSNSCTHKDFLNFGMSSADFEKFRKRLKNVIDHGVDDLIEHPHSVQAVLSGRVDGLLFARLVTSSCPLTHYFTYEYSLKSVFSNADRLRIHGTVTSERGSHVHIMEFLSTHWRGGAEFSFPWKRTGYDLNQVRLYYGKYFMFPSLPSILPHDEKPVGTKDVSKLILSTSVDHDRCEAKTVRIYQFEDVKSVCFYAMYNYCRNEIHKEWANATLDDSILKYSPSQPPSFLMEHLRTTPVITRRVRDGHDQIVTHKFDFWGGSQTKFVLMQYSGSCDSVEWDFEAKQWKLLVCSCDQHGKNGRVEEYPIPQTMQEYCSIPLIQVTCSR